MKVLRGQSHLVDGKWISREVSEEEDRFYRQQMEDGRKTMRVIQQERNKGITPCSPNGQLCETSGNKEDLEVFDFEMRNWQWTTKWYVGAFIVCKKCGYTWQYDANI